MEIKPLPPRSVNVLRRVLVGLSCVLAFLVMASVITPEQTRAGGVQNQHPWPGIPPRSVEHAALSARQSTDAHSGLQSLGSIEDRGMCVTIYATEVGPRYTIHDAKTGEELGTLLSLEQAQRAFPDLDLGGMEFNAMPLLLADVAF